MVEPSNSQFRAAAGAFQKGGKITCNTDTNRTAIKTADAANDLFLQPEGKDGSAPPPKEKCSIRAGVSIAYNNIKQFFDRVKVVFVSIGRLFKDHWRALLVLILIAGFIVGCVFGLPILLPILFAVPAVAAIFIFLVFMITISVVIFVIHLLFNTDVPKKILQDLSWAFSCLNVFCIQAGS